MVDFSSIDFDSTNISETISMLKDKSVNVPKWEKLFTDYEPMKHAILSDTTSLKDKVRSDGQVDKSARIVIGLEKLHVKRMAEFTFSIPVKGYIVIWRITKREKRLKKLLSLFIKMYVSIVRISDEQSPIMPHVRYSPCGTQ